MKETLEGAGGAEPRGSARLVTAAGVVEPPIVELGDGEVVLGRQAACDLRLGSDVASRRHARVGVRDGSWFVEDLNSKNGTAVNGVRLRAGVPTPLRDLDRIEIGSVRLLFVTGETGGERIATIALDRTQVSAEAADALRRFLKA